MAEEDLIALRKEKLERLRSRGIDPYPHRFSPSHTAAEAAALTPEDGTGPEATVAGRVTAVPDMGTATFIDLRDCSRRSTSATSSASAGRSSGRGRRSRPSRRTT